MTRLPRWYRNGSVIWLCTGLPLWLVTLSLSSGPAPLLLNADAFEWMLAALMWFLPLALVEAVRDKSSIEARF